MNGSLSTGIRYLMRGFDLIMQPGLRLFVLIPLTINVIIFSLLLYLSFGQFAQWIQAAVDWLPGWLSFLEWIMWPLAVVLMMTVVFYSFSIIANLIASPFNGLLAEKAEELLTGEEVIGYETIGQALLAFPKSLMREVHKLVYYLPLALLALILSLIFAPAAAVIWFALGMWMMAIQYCDYPMDNNQKSFADMKRALAARRLTSCGFGSAVMLGTMIPVVNFLIMPAAICGATAFWVEELKAQLPQGPSA
jgi:CysZ protein